MNNIILYIAMALLFNGCATPEKKQILVTEGELTLPTLPSSHKPLESIGNVHLLREDGRILRGATPEGKAAVLKKEKVTDVLIFRKSKDNGEKEITELRQLGYRDKQIHSVSMKWRDLKSFEEGCRHVLTALRVMGEVEKNPKRKLYLHCTMGEDRTGMISGLYRMVFQNWSAEKAYQEEMCDRGFADANPRKPVEVASAVNENLKDLYARMAVLIEEGRLNKNLLNEEICIKPAGAKPRVRFLLSQKCD